MRMVPETESRGGRRTRMKRWGRQREPDSQVTQGQEEEGREKERDRDLGSETQTPAPRQAAGGFYLSVSGGGTTASQHRKSQVRAQEATRTHASSLGFGGSQSRWNGLRSGVNTTMALLSHGYKRHSVHSLGADTQTCELG